MGIIIYYLKDAAPEKIKQNPSKFTFNPRQWFHTCQIDWDKIDNFLFGISNTIEEYKVVFDQKNGGPTDFTPMKDRPLIRHKSKYWVMDLQFLIDKIDSGIFWKVNEGISTKDKEQFLQNWGENFQDYVNWLLKLSCKNDLNRVLETPKFVGSNDEVCDTIIVCGNSAVFIETKGGFLRTEAKYGGNPNLLFEELKKKLIGDVGKRKGVTQLTHSIKLAFDRKNPLKIEDLEYSKIHKIFPVLLIKDELGECLFVTHFLNRFFKSYIQKKAVKPKIITPLFCLGIETMEDISGYLEEVSLVSLLESWHENDHGLQGSFLAIENSVKQRFRERPNNFLIQKEDELWSAVITQFFPGETI